MNNISEHISYQEACNSQTAAKLGIDNTPTAAILIAMGLVANKCFEPVRRHFNKPLIVTSFYRSPKLNKAIGGATASQHMKGEAIDMKGGSAVSNRELFKWMLKNVDFDQLIWEYGDANSPDWIHVSYSATGNRRKALRAVKQGGKTIYKPFDIQL